MRVTLKGSVFIFKIARLKEDCMENLFEDRLLSDFFEELAFTLEDFLFNGSSSLLDAL